MTAQHTEQSEWEEFSQRLIFEAQAMRKAVAGEHTEGTFHALNWSDKSHRVVYDACSLMEKAAALLAADKPAESGGEAVDWESQFDQWWDEHGQYCRAGGGGYERTFAYRAWEAAMKLYTHPQPQPSALPDDVVKDAERYFPPEFEVWQGDEMCASASGPRDEALREAIRYAAQYEQDGPVRVFEVMRTFIDAAMLKEGK